MFFFFFFPAIVFPFSCGGWGLNKFFGYLKNNWEKKKKPCFFLKNIPNKNSLPLLWNKKLRKKNQWGWYIWIKTHIDPAVIMKEPPNNHGYNKAASIRTATKNAERFTELDIILWFSENLESTSWLRDWSTAFDNLHGFGAVPDTHTTPMQRDLPASACPPHSRERDRDRDRERKCVQLVYDPSWQKKTIVFQAILKCIWDLTSAY